MHTRLPDTGSGDPGNGNNKMSGETGNSILDLLPAAAQRSVQKSLVTLPAGAQLLGQGDRVTHAFFPTTAVCSMVVELSSGDKAETATVGRDGFLGVTLVLGMPVSHSSGFIQSPGEGYKLSARNVLDLCKHHESFRRALFGYTGFCLHMASRTLACNSFHSIVQRMARWLLFSHDRAGKDDFRLTHEALSHMLTATRPRVSQAAAKLKADGIIDYRHGVVRILDRARLERMSCECYQETRRLSPQLKQ